MKKLREFYDARQAHAYLSDSIIRIKGEPAYILMVEGVTNSVYNILYILLSDVENRKTIRYPNDDIDLSPVPLGLVNSPKGGCVYTCRLPSRMWKIGLNSHNLETTDVLGRNVRYATNNFMLSKPFSDTILGKFCTYADAVIKSAKQEHTVAFSRFFSVLNGKELYYKNIGKVGEVQGDRPVLYDNYHYLTEALGVARQ